MPARHTARTLPGTPWECHRRCSSILHAKLPYESFRVAMQFNSSLMHLSVVAGSHVRTWSGIELVASIFRTAQQTPITLSRPTNFSATLETHRALELLAGSCNTGDVGGWGLSRGVFRISWFWSHANGHVDGYCSKHSETEPALLIAKYPG